MRHPLEVDPALYSASAPLFCALRNAEDDGARQLALLSDAGSCDRLRDAAERLGIEPTFFAGFKNAAEACRDPEVRLRGFVFSRYEQACESAADALSGLFWSPARGLLSWAHHAWACREFADRLSRIAPEGTKHNYTRSPRAMGLAKATCRWCQDEHLACLDDVADREIIRVGPAFFSAIAQTFREAARGRRDMEAFWNLLGQRSQQDRKEVLQSAAFLIRLGGELFAFYMLLWELLEWSKNR